MIIFLQALSANGDLACLWAVAMGNDCRDPNDLPDAPAYTVPALGASLARVGLVGRCRENCRTITGEK